MTTWLQFSDAAPDLAAFGKLRLAGQIAYMATIRPDGSPRLHPVSPVFTGKCLFVYMEPTSPKVHDLRRDARYAMHCAVEDNSGRQGEFLITGHAVEIKDTKTRAAAFEQARKIGYNPRERYVLFELGIHEAIATLYEQGEPKRTRWKAAISTASPQPDQESNDSR